jgi:hypothetical protein
VLLDPAFGELPPRQREETYTALQTAAARQGMPGEVAAIWKDRAGRTRFIAPAQQHPFFQLMSYGQLHAQVNGSLEFSI